MTPKPIGINTSKRLADGKLVTVLSGGAEPDIAQISISSIVSKMAMLPLPFIEDEEPAELPETADKVKKTLEFAFSKFS